MLIVIDGHALASSNFCVVNLAHDWRKELIQYLQDPTSSSTKKLKLRATYYVLLAGILYKKYSYGVLLRCWGPKEALLVMIEVYKGIYGAHQLGLKMRWLLFEQWFYWPTIQKDCLDYTRRCPACQKFEPVQHVPTQKLQSIVKYCLFKD